MKITGYLELQLKTVPLGMTQPNDTKMQVFSLKATRRRWSEGWAMTCSNNHMLKVRNCRRTSHPFAACGKNTIGITFAAEKLRTKRNSLRLKLVETNMSF